MIVKKKNQFIKCPKCGEIVNIQGVPGEKKEVVCPGYIATFLLQVFLKKRARIKWVL